MIDRPRLLAAVLAVAALPSGASRADDEAPLFDERAAETGLDFRHVNGATGRFHLVEIMGAGAGLVDYDGDGDLDVYLVQGNRLEGPVDPSITDRLFRNDLAPIEGRTTLRFVDVSAAAGLGATAGYGMGIAAGDVEGDGDVDLYRTAFGPNVLLVNRGDGTFEDRTEAARAQDERWSVPAVFADLDADGRQDLWIGNYLEYRPSVAQRCTSAAGAPDYCGPLSFAPLADRLLRNRGDGTFEDWTERSGMGVGSGGALGGVAADLDADGRPELYVGNDMTPNHLWRPADGGTFRDDALLSGSAVSWEGTPQASMGIDVADFDEDGDEDLFLSHLTGEANTLYVNDGAGGFEDRSVVAGLAAPSWSATGFGTVWLDADLDADLDLVVVNGAVRTLDALAAAGDPVPLHQPNQLFLRGEDGRFADASHRVPALSLSEVSRGAAGGDLDLDGTPDVVTSNNAGPARLLLHRPREHGSWSAVRLRPASGEADARGARVLLRAGDAVLHRRSRVDGSYASSHDPTVLASLPAAETVEIGVSWPDGGASRLLEVPTGRLLVLRQRPGASP